MMSISPHWCVGRQPILYWLLHANPRPFANVLHIYMVPLQAALHTLESGTRMYPCCAV